MASDSCGFLHFLQVSSLKLVSAIKTVDTNSQKAPITCMQTMRIGGATHLLTGDYLGKVKIYSL